ncbi:MAG: hypothetical protein ACTH9T_02270 [Mycetocola reblochoni]|uniref:Uncharacterized protein n=1 Tax=Mycetocola reblochoni REB411 TaxID=1255698 RepID=A0A1R4JYB6_9MICO|nr:hypothetical protein [Mycetocola reblochoni]SJN36894.1 hypothetical protein FM119_10175 [Mycetocola reblochoni REB411]
MTPHPRPADHTGAGPRVAPGRRTRSTPRRGPHRAVRVRLVWRLFVQGTAVTFALLIPVLVVLSWLEATRGGLDWVPGFTAAVVAVYLVALVAYLRVGLFIGPDSIAERPFAGPTRTIPLDRVSRAVLLDMHRSMSVPSRPQLFLLDAEGRVLLRMRGEYWRHSDIALVASRVDAVLERVPKPVTLNELQESNPRLLFWFERRPWLRP